jgi:hypothetical protein
MFNARWYPVWLFIAWAVIGPGPEFVTESALSISSRVADARIVANHQEHDTCRVAFVAGGKNYTATARDCGQDEIGAVIPVYYVPAAPFIFSTRLPGNNWPADIAIMLGALLLAVVASLFRKPE